MVAREPDTVRGWNYRKGGVCSLLNPIAVHNRHPNITNRPPTEPSPRQARPMLELIWAPLLGAFSLLFDEYSDPRLLSICLSGFAAAACLSASLGVANLRDVFVTSLCSSTGLHSPGSMRPKNALAFRALLRVAATVGDALEDRWGWGFVEGVEGVGGWGGWKGLFYVLGGVS